MISEKIEKKCLSISVKLNIHLTSKGKFILFVLADPNNIFMSTGFNVNSMMFLKNQIRSGIN